MTYNLYIGSDNKTKKVNTGKIIEVLSVRHHGFSLMPMTGYWDGEVEYSVMIVLADDETRVTETIAILKTELEQEAIGYQQVPEMLFY